MHKQPLPRFAAQPGQGAPGGGSVYQLRFESLFVEGRGLAFPCDADGQVLWDALSERARPSYLDARERVGREYRQPLVQACLASRSAH